MFRSLEELLGPTVSPPTGRTFEVHPLQLSRWLDEAWAASGLVPNIPGVTPAGASAFLGDSQIINTLDLPDPSIKPSGIDAGNPDNWTGNPGPTSSPASTAGIGVIWDHLMYAYAIESTGVIEIFSEVMRRIVIGESMGTLSQAGTRWVRATEELFFRDPPLFRILGVQSELRPMSRVNRRNVYWRMFGLEVPHPIPPRWGSSADSQWKSDLGNGVNADFRAKWSELLRQVWLGIENRNNSAGANAADVGYIVLLVQALRDMMGNRRRSGMLAREEFAYVAMMSWFHLTLDFDSPIVVDLKAEATAPEQRLERIAQRVGMTPAARSRELFLLADPASKILRAIELGLFSNRTDAARLFNGSNTDLLDDMNKIIDLWQSATGERVKDRPVGNVVVSSPQPLRIPSANKPAAIPVSSNGRG